VSDFHNHQQEYASADFGQVKKSAALQLTLIFLGDAGYKIISTAQRSENFNVTILTLPAVATGREERPLRSQKMLSYVTVI
jgi:hypothetical protein